MLDLKLRTKVTIVMILVTSIVIVVNAAVLSLDFTKRYTVALQSEAKAHVSGIAREILNTLSYGISINAIDGLEGKCSEIVNDNSNIGYAMVVDSKGQILYHSSASEMGKKRDAKWLEGTSRKIEGKYVVQESITLFILCHRIMLHI